MSPDAIRVLVVDDNPADCFLAQEQLEGRGFTVTVEQEPAQVLDRVRQQEFDVVVTDQRLISTSGTELCAAIKQVNPDLPVVVLTGYAELPAAVQAIRAGAHDFVSKEANWETLAHVFQRAANYYRMHRAVQRLETQSQRAVGSELVGESRGMRAVLDLVDRVAPTSTAVLITGESGTGKELIARQLHQAGPRKTEPFVAINCASVPASLFEVELFGTVPGATQTRQGAFRLADKGTLFLDEIAQSSLDGQAKLLQVLQEGAVRPVDSDTSIRVDVRVVAATNHDLEALVEAGTFRRDLFYRLNVVPIHVPPLRTRGNDLQLLAQHYVTRFGRQLERGERGLSPDAASLLLRYDWPGIVRELENCIERAVTLARFEQITVEDLPEAVRQHETGRIMMADAPNDDLPTLDELERRYISQVLKLVNGNKTHAAKVLGVDRRTLYRKLERMETEQERRESEVIQAHLQPAPSGTSQPVS
jgi:two-component system response regulator HydG